MRKFLVVLLLVAASAALAREVEFEEFGASTHVARAVASPGHQTLDPGQYYVPVVATLPGNADPELERAVEFRPLSSVMGADLRLECWFTAY